MRSKSCTVTSKRWRQRGFGFALQIQFAVFAGLLLGAASPLGAQEAPTADEWTAHIEQAARLLVKDQASDALRELDLAYAIRQEPRVLFLQGLAQQKLGNSQQALKLLERFVAASGDQGNTYERSEAARRIAELRLLLKVDTPNSGPAASAPAEPAPRSPPTARAPVQRDLPMPCPAGRLVRRVKHRIWQVAIDCPQRGLQLKVVDRNGRDRAEAATLVMFDENLKLALALPDEDLSEDDAVQATGLAPTQPEQAPLPEAGFWTYRGTYRVPRSTLLAAMLLPREDEDKGGLPATQEETNRSAVLALSVVYNSVRSAHLLGTSDSVSLAVAKRRHARVAGTVLMSIGLVSTLDCWLARSC